MDEPCLFSRNLNVPPDKFLKKSNSSKKKESFGPLKFPDSSVQQPDDIFGFFKDHDVKCILCKSRFQLPGEKAFFLVHLLDTHKLIIADVDKIAGLKGYCDYWRTRFSVAKLDQVCSKILCKDDQGEQKDEYFLLSNAISEDACIREGLQKKRLECILDTLAQERATPISRSCMFCRWEFKGARGEFFDHLYEKHNFHLGSPKNLVFTDELLDILDKKMESLECLFCDGVFPERTILKEHMRKKQHKRINPDNKMFDRFYVINYLEMGKSWQQIQSEPDEVENSDDTSNWSDWEDDDVEPLIVCLFCDEGRAKFEDILDHLCRIHNFHFLDSCAKLGLDFYQQVKLVNYIRLQVYNLQCIKCMEAFSAKDELLKHMSQCKHFGIPERKFWDQPEFFFPTYENDSFLCHLDDANDNVIGESVASDIPETCEERVLNE